jgi:hypothetical protein
VRREFTLDHERELVEIVADFRHLVRVPETICGMIHRHYAAVSFIRERETVAPL